MNEQQDTASKGWRARQPRVCVECGVTFTPRAGNQKTCGIECSSARRSKKMREAFARRYQRMTPEERREKSRRGKVLSKRLAAMTPEEREEHRRKVSEANRLRYTQAKEADADIANRVYTGRHVDTCGYVRLATARGTVRMEHRVVMERHLGRLLEDHEQVHHRNRVKTDNRIENLELWSSSHPAGGRAEDLVTYAIEILSQYAPEHLKDPPTKATRTRP